MGAMSSETVLSVSLSNSSSVLTPSTLASLTMVSAVGSERPASYAV
ncbi:hypothetical protein [Phage blackswan219-1]|nr:hypothetical protein [Phage blackswan219-1]